MVTLKKQEISADSGIGELEDVTSHATTQEKNPEEWVKAAEFVPGQLWKGSGRIVIALSLPIFE